MLHKQGIFEEKAQEYWKADKGEKSLILDAVVNVSGLSRKRAIRRFRLRQTRDPCHTEQRGRPQYYTPDVITALKDVWDIGSEACGENLHSQISGYIDTQIKGNDWNHGDVVTNKLRAMSLGSVKKYVGQFERRRLSFGGKSTTQKSAVISMVPIRMDGWETAETGVTQIDTVAHCGDSVAGDYVCTTNGTDVATMWGSRSAQWCKGQEATKDSLARMRGDSPHPWTEIHPDSGKEFINAHCVAYATDSNLRMTRSRPYHKNDNCFVEERNGHVIRAYVGFGRLDVREVVSALNDLYDVLTPYLNHFIASRRIVVKERVGARWKVTREKVSKTPYQRILERSDVREGVKKKLCTAHGKLNPKTMRKEIDRLTKRVHAIQRRYGTPRKLPKTA